MPQIVDPDVAELEFRMGRMQDVVAHLRSEEAAAGRYNFDTLKVDPEQEAA